MKRHDQRRPLVFAHRGASKVAPENTLPAFEAAAELGADGVELDVQYTSDGKLVVIHNPTLEATTDGTGRVTAHTLEELRRLDAGARFTPPSSATAGFPSRFTGARIPTLDEVLELLKHRLLINIELKALDRATLGMGSDVVAAVRAHGMADQVVLSSFNPFALRRAKRAGPEIECGLLLAPDLPAWMRWAITRRHSLADGLHPEMPMVDEAYMVQALRLGMPVRVWTVNEEADIRRLVGLGVDAIITDVPDVALRCLRPG